MVRPRIDRQGHDRRLLDGTSDADEGGYREQGPERARERDSGERYRCYG